MLNVFIPVLNILSRPDLIDDYDSDAREKNTVHTALGEVSSIHRPGCTKVGYFSYLSLFSTSNILMVNET